MPNFHLKPIKLYKIHDDEECQQLLNLTRYLYSNGYDIRPFHIQERGFPSNINRVPTSVFQYGKIIQGYSKILEYYQDIFRMDDLDKRSDLFHQKNPNYRISDRSTHKNIE